MSKSAGGRLEGAGAAGGGGFGIDFLMAGDLDLVGDIFALRFDGDRGISGDTASVEGAIFRVTECEANYLKVAQGSIDKSSPATA